jgi:dipeptidase E
MKLLLTSNGLSNQSIANALFELVGKPAPEIKIVFIPTASNGVTGDKEWFIDDLVNIKKQGFKQIEIADISALPKEKWLLRFQEADVLFFEGGSNYHLMRWIVKSGLQEFLPDLLKTKVWVGVSAGSMVTNKTLLLRVSQIIYEEDLGETEDMAGLQLVDFYILPHLNSPYFPKLRKAEIEAAISNISETVYALDDNSAVKVVDGSVEVISEGEYLKFN